MALSDRQIRALQPATKPYKVADGRGLYIEVRPTGSKLWRLKYRVGRKEKRLALGVYPDVPLAEARRRSAAAKIKIESGIDPSLERRREKAAARFSADNTFVAIAKEYISKMQSEGKADSTLRKANWFLDLLKPSLGNLPITEVDPQLLLEALRRQESRGNFETAKKCRSFASRVFRYGVQTGRTQSDPAALLQGALISPKVQHYPAILEPEKLGELLRCIDTYQGYPSTKFALLIAPHVFLRPGELRKATWLEIDLEEMVWEIPAERMKARRAHRFPLSKQVVRILVEAKRHSGGEGYVFPASHTHKRPLSENSLNAAFRRMGFSKDVVTAHGLRSTASTLLNESGLWNPDAIERALAHADRDQVRGAYHRATYWDERKRMVQWWSDYLDRNKFSSKIEG